MAKKQDLGGLLKPRGQTDQPTDGKTQATKATPPQTAQAKQDATDAGTTIGPNPVTAGPGVPLRKSEHDELQAIADEHHASRTSLLSYAVRYFLRDYRKGKIALKIKGLKFVQPDE